MNFRPSTSPDAKQEPMVGIQSWVLATDLVSVESVVAALPVCADVTQESSLSSALDRFDQGKVIVILSDPLSSFASALERGRPLSAVAAEWKTYAEGLLKALVQAGQRVVAIELQMIADPSDSRWSLVADQLGVEQSSIVRHPIEYDQPTSTAILIADAAIRCDAELSKILVDLRSLIVGFEREVFSISLAEAALVERNAFVSEMSVLRESLASQLDAAAKETRQNAEVVDSLRRSLAINAREREVFKSTIGSLRLSQQQSDMQISKLVNEIDLLNETVRDMGNAQTKTMESLEKLSAELSHVYSSKSWRVTKPLRVTRGYLGEGLFNRMASYMRKLN